MLSASSSQILTPSHHAPGPGHILREHENPDATAKYPGEELLVWQKAQGSEIISSRGHRFIDLCACFGSLPLGHNHPQITKAIRAHIDHHGPVMGWGDVYATGPKVQLIKALRNFLPEGFDQIALCVTGSDSVEYALKTALLITQKPGVLAYRGSYHGLSLGALQLTGMDKFSSILPSGPWTSLHGGVTFIKRSATPEQIRKIIRQSQSTPTPIGQMIVEPVSGRGGGFGWTCEEGHQLYNMLRSEKVLLIFDEVLTGMGRCGAPFMASSMPADLLCLGKALGGGMPLSAIAAPAHLMKHWPDNRGEAYHTGTYFGHALSCLVAHTTLEVLVQQRLVERSQKLGYWLCEWAQELCRSEQCLGGDDRATKKIEYRGRGLLGALDLGYPRAGVELSTRLRHRGVIALPCGEEGTGLALTPALNIPHDLLQQALEIVAEEVNDMMAERQKHR